MHVPRPTPARTLPNLYARAITTSHLEADRDEEAHVTATNEALVASGLRALRDPLAVFVCQGIAEKFGEGWWTEGVLEVFVHDRTPTIEDVRKHRKLPASGTIDELANALDINGCLILLTKHWARIFGPVLGQDHRGWAYELMGVRNKNKHLGSEDHPSDYAWRALDTMYRLCSSIDETSAAQLLALRSSVDLSDYGQTSTSDIRLSSVAHALASVDGNDSAAASADAGAQEDLEADLSTSGPDFSGADLRKMNFSGANLKGADFSGSDLRGANFANAVLVGATFKSSDLAGANLSGADLTRAHFESTRLSAKFAWSGYTQDEKLYAANLAGAILDGATLNFAGCDLRRADLTGTNLDGADFTKADMRGTILDGATLTRAIFTRTNLAGARLLTANLTEAHFESTRLSAKFAWSGYTQDEKLYAANLAGAILDGATLNFAGCDLRRADLTGTNLDGADFTKADMRGTILDGAIITRAIFHGTSLAGASLHDADLAGASFRNTNLSEKFAWSGYISDEKLYAATLVGAKLDGATLNFAGCDLRRADLTGTNLDGADFSGAKLGDAVLSGASLRGVNLKDADIKGVKSEGVRWT